MINQEFQHHLIDIHGGGMDLKFPHHENEIAQSRAAYNTSIANYWMHNGMVNIDGEKMSKSLGNVVWAKDLMEQIGANTMRWMMLSAHYRAPLNINEESIESARKESEKVLHTLKQAEIKLQLAKQRPAEQAQGSAYMQFMEAMQDDLNTPNAFSALFDATKKLNQALRQKECDWEGIAMEMTSLRHMLEVLGIVYEPVTLSETDHTLFAKWNQAKADRDFASADAYRMELNTRGLL